MRRDVLRDGLGFQSIKEPLMIPAQQGRGAHDGSSNNTDQTKTRTYAFEAAGLLNW